MTDSVEGQKTTKSDSVGIDMDPPAVTKLSKPNLSKEIECAGLSTEIERAQTDPVLHDTTATTETPSCWKSYTHKFLERFRTDYEIKSMRASQKRKDARAQYQFSGKRMLSEEEKEARSKEVEAARAHCAADYARAIASSSQYRDRIQSSVDRLARVQKGLDILKEGQETDSVRSVARDGLWFHIQYMAQGDDEKATLLVKIGNLPELAERSAKARERRALKKNHRLNFGFEFHGGCVAGNPGYRRAPFTYRGLVSDEHPLLQMFVTKLNKRKCLRAGSTKEESWQPDSKLEGLDFEYVTGNGNMIGFIRVDVDGTFISWEDLKGQIGRQGCPAPNLMVGHTRPDGIVQNPHLIWILHKSVVATKNGRSGPVGLLNGIMRGLYGKLLGIGADPGGISNPLRVKNPCSPLWSYCTGELLPYRLQANAELDAKDPLPSHTATAEIYTRMADLEGGQFRNDKEAEKTESNALWINMVRWARENVHAFRDERKESVRDFERAIETAGFGFMGTKDREIDVYRKARLIAGWTWKNIALIKPKMSPAQIKEVQRKSARGTSLCVTIRNKTAIQTAIKNLTEKGLKCTKAEVIRETGLSPKTVSKYWNNEAEDEVLDGKREASAIERR